MKRMIVLTTLAVILMAWCAGPADAWTFVHITDIHASSATAEDNGIDAQGKTFAKMVAQIITLNPSFVTAGGDLATYGTDAANYTAMTGSLIKSSNTWYLKKADGTSSGIPIYFTPGNHDYRNSLHLGASLAGYDNNIAYVPGTPPVQPGTTTACVFGSGTAIHDYYFIKGNALVISLWSGSDASLDVCWPKGSGLETDQMTFFYKAIKDNSAKTPKIVFMHHPAVNSTDNGVDNGVIKNNRTAFLDTCEKYGILVMSGHAHQDWVLQRSGGNWASGAKYVLTDACKNAAYRVMTVNADNSVTVGDRQTLQADKIENPQADVTSPVEGMAVPTNSEVTIKVEPKTPNVMKADVSVDNVFVQSLYPGHWWLNYRLPSKGVSCKIQVKAYDNLGRSNTATVNVIKGASSYYNKMSVGNTCYVVDPKDGHTAVCVLENVVSGSPSYAVVRVDGLAHTVNAGQMKRVNSGNSGLFIYAATVYQPGQFAELMIAPYQYPSVDILTPTPWQNTGNCQVQVATNYSGKNVPWNGIGNPPLNPLYLKTMRYNGAAGDYYNNETYNWTMSGSAGTRTMTVTLRDSLGTTVSKSVTVNYNPAIPFYVYRGPFGDNYKSISLSISNYEATRIYIDLRIDYWDGDSWEWMGGTTIESSRQWTIDWIVSTLARAANGMIPTGGLGVFVVDRNQYNSGTFSAARFGTITWKEVYDALAISLGRDPTGKYRVWSSVSAAARSSADAIYDAAAPSLEITNPLNGSDVCAGSAIAINANAGDDNSVSKVEFYVNSALYATDNAAPYTYNWTVPATAGVSYLITAKAYDVVNKVTIREVSVRSVTGVVGSGIGLYAAYYDNMDFTGTCKTKVDPRIYFNWVSGSPDPAIGADTWSARWTGLIQPKYSETYTFYTVSNDGVRLFIDGYKIIDNWTDHADVENTGTITLTAGKQYKIMMDHYDNTGTASAQLFWSSASQPREIVPDIQLYPGKPAIWNGDFEYADFRNWTVSSTSPPIPYEGPSANQSYPPHPCQFYVARQKYNGGSTTIQQQVSLPADARYVKYYLEVTARSSGSTPDYPGYGVAATIDIINGAVTTNLQTNGPYPGTVSWQEFTRDISAFAGKTVTLRLIVSNSQTFPYDNSSVAVVWDRIKFTDVNGVEIITLPAGTEMPVPPSTALVSYWKLDEALGATAFDVTGNGNNGTLVNGPTWVAGKAGNALSFDGVDDYVQFSTNYFPTGDAQHTISAWIYVNAKPANRAWIALLGPEGAGAHHWLINSAGATQFGIWNGSAQVQPSLPVGAWTHVVIAYDGTYLKSYVNGALSQTVTVTGQRFALTSAFDIARSHIGENYFNGKLDDVRIYNRALSAAEVQFLFANPGKSGEEIIASNIRTSVIPTVTQLLRCAPNPFTGQTAINFQLAQPAQTSIKVYNITGQVVKTLVNECLRPGYHSVRWDGKDANGNKVAAGVYLYRMSAGEYSQTNKLTVLR